MMSVATYRRNCKWLDDKSPEYPHQCKTKVKYPRPEDVDIRDFIRVPFQKHAVWAFANIEDLHKFKKLYVTLKS